MGAGSAPTRVWDDTALQRVKATVSVLGTTSDAGEDALDDGEAEATPAPIRSADQIERLRAEIDRLEQARARLPAGDAALTGFIMRERELQAELSRLLGTHAGP
jgi:hypothetical protein